jgi:hypothetical protein
VAAAVGWVATWTCGGGGAAAVAAAVGWVATWTCAWDGAVAVAEGAWGWTTCACVVGLLPPVRDTTATVCSRPTAARARIVTMASERRMRGTMERFIVVS